MMQYTPTAVPDNIGVLIPSRNSEHSDWPPLKGILTLMSKNPFSHVLPNPSLTHRTSKPGAKTLGRSFRKIVSLGDKDMQLHLCFIQQYQMHPSPTELLPPKPQPGKHSKPCGQNNWQNEGQGKFQVGGLAQGFCE